MFSLDRIADDLAKDISNRFYKLDLSFIKSPGNKSRYSLSDIETLGYQDKEYTILLNLAKEYLQNYDFGIDISDVVSRDLGDLEDLVIYNVEKLPFRREYAHDRLGYFDPEEMSLDIPFWSIVADVCRDNTYLDKKILFTRLSKIIRNLLRKAYSYNKRKQYFHKVPDDSHSYKHRYL